MCTGNRKYRIQPQDLYNIRNEVDVNNKEFGNDGEFALQYLGLHGDDPVNNENVIIDKKIKNSLGNLVRMWMDKISPGISPQITVNMPLLQVLQDRTVLI